MDVRLILSNMWLRRHIMRLVVLESNLGQFTIFFSAVARDIVNYCGLPHYYYDFKRLVHR